MEDHGVIQEQKYHEIEKGKKDHEEQEEEEEEAAAAARGGGEKGGGLITHLFSNLVSPLSPQGSNERKRKLEVNDEKTSGDDGRGDYKSEEDLNGAGAGGGGGGGIINNLISNLLHRSEAKEREEDKGNQSHEGKENGVKTEEEGGGGIIGNLVSHLPTTLADGVVPPTDDEASILIHSIVHD